VLGEGIPADAIVSRFSLEEALSVPFELRVEWSTKDPDFVVESLLGQSAALQVLGSLTDERIVHGIITQTAFVRVVGERMHFRLVIRPALFALSQREDCRIFQEKNAQEIISEILDEAGLADAVQWHLTGSLATRDFTVQYRESSLNFIQRLMEDEGIFYAFTHEKDGHQLQFFDGLSGLDGLLPEAALSVGEGTLSAAAPLAQFSRRRRLRTSVVHVRDFDFANPAFLPEASIPTESPHQQPLYTYPAGFQDANEGQKRATTLLKTLRHDADVGLGQTRRCDAHVGVKISVEGAEEEELNGEYFVIRSFTEGLAHAHSDEGKEQNCSVSFESVPAQAPYLPARRARRPQIHGIQTALVVGDDNSDQNIFVDKFGRIKVHFHWDRLQPHDENASCWVRVNQLPLGGSMILPRVGWEVLVAFEEGNPDRPIVLGRTYNAENMPPASLPASKASGSFSSKSSPNGAGSNELSLGDSGGSQGFSIKAQKDLNWTTNYDQNETVAINDTHQVNANLSQSIKVDESLEVAGNQSETFGANISTKVSGSRTVDIGGNRTSNATANYLEKMNADRSFEVGGNKMMLCNGERYTVQGNVSRTVGTAQVLCTTGNFSQNTLATCTSKVGAVRVHLVKGSHGEVVAGAKSVNVSAGAVHVTKGDFSSECEGAEAHIVGAMVSRKAKGDLYISSAAITLAGGKGTFKAGGGEMSLAGGPIKLKGSTIAIKAAMVKLTSGSLKLG
jgi:type VI secretion system secreted protein VgrG